MNTKPNIDPNFCLSDNKDLIKFKKLQAFFHKKHKLICTTIREKIMAIPLQFTDAAAKKVKDLIADEKNSELKLRVYITGGGCSGFQYGFTFDDKINDGDMTIEKQGVALVVDPMSLQYLIGGKVDYTENLNGSRFMVTNPKAKSTCGCGFSFSI